jgi:2'-5' RNA ligase
MTVSDTNGPEPNRSEPPVRVFVGVKIAPEVARELASSAAGLEKLPAVRLVALADIHLTLVPPWDAASIPEAIDKLRLVAGRFDAFRLTFEHVGYGPDPKRPRLLWAECTATAELPALRAALLEACGRSEERPLRPHVTLARIRENGRAIARAHPVDRPLSLRQQIEAIELLRSRRQDGSARHGGSGYEVLASLRLGDAVHSAALEPNSEAQPWQG